jgi:hypothetical protein
MKTENMLSGGSYVINPETHDVEKVESTISQEEAAAKELEQAAQAPSKSKKTDQGDK